MLDYATGKWDENAKVIRRHYGYFESSVHCHCLLVCWHGPIRVLAIQRRSCRLDYAQFAERRIVSSWVRSERLICRQFAFYHISNIEYFRRLAQSVQAMLAFGIFITHGVACYVAIDLVWTNYVVEKITKDSRKMLCEYVVRTMIVLLTCNYCCFHILCVLIPPLIIIHPIDYFLFSNGDLQKI